MIYLIKNIPIEQFLKIYKTVPIIDIRRIESFNNGHIDGARNIPFEQLIIAPEKYLEKNKIYYIYCQKGTKSIKACQILGKQGYVIYNILGGYESWILAK